MKFWGIGLTRSAPSRRLCSVLLVMLCGCSDPGSPSFAIDVQPILDDRCLCHMEGSSGTMVAPTLTLNADVAFSQLVGTSSTQAPAVLRVKAGDPEASYLWRKLTGTHVAAGGSGNAMPPTGTLPIEERDAVETWILEGALP
jgi:hypothetical protein